MIAIRIADRFRPNLQKKKRHSPSGSKRIAPVPGVRSDDSRHPLPRLDWAGFKGLLATPVSGASLAFLRICVGAVLILEAYSLCTPSQMASGTVPLDTYYAGPGVHFNFPYSSLEWLPLLPPYWIYAIVGVQALAGLLMALGLFYRLSAASAFLAFGYLFAVESTKTYWQSYYYIELLFLFLLIWMPAARRFSVDAWRLRTASRSQMIPFWPVFLLRGQLVIMYFYAGVAKLNADWLLDAAPLRWVLRESHVGTSLGPWLSAAQLGVVQGWLHSNGVAYFLSYAGAVFDLGIGFLLLVRRTRILAITLMIAFHATNHFIIYDNIDWFPLVGVATALIFLDVDWPERIWRWLRRPALAKPDWGWLTVGAVLFPGVGALLGWKLSPTRIPSPAQEPFPFRRSTLVFVTGWLTWQALLPLRHYLIPGDARITYEGLSFSWRLKTDEHRAMSAQLWVKDPKIIPLEPGASPRIDWTQWHGDKVIYRRIVPGRIDWRQLPEIFVLLEPVVGERIIYNPLAAGGYTGEESRNRVRELWRERYGRVPSGVQQTLPVAVALQPIVDGLVTAGHRAEAAQLAAMSSGNPAALAGPLGELKARDPSGTILSRLRLLNPFALNGDSAPGPYLVIEDPQLFVESKEGAFQIDPKQWKGGPETRGASDSPGVYAGGEPLVIYMADIGPDASRRLPQTCIIDSQKNPEQPPRIWWNPIHELGLSKINHISNQPFYLRRYARRIAELWEKEYGRRPMVNATTAVSLNRRPFQPLVAPETDLATVPVVHFGHNPWIMDLKTPRIPQAALADAKSK